MQNRFGNAAHFNQHFGPKTSAVVESSKCSGGVISFDRPSGETGAWDLVCKAWSTCFFECRRFQSDHWIVGYPCSHPGACPSAFIGQVLSSFHLHLEHILCEEHAEQVLQCSAFQPTLWAKDIGCCWKQQMFWGSHLFRSSKWRDWCLGSSVQSMQHVFFSMSQVSIRPLDCGIPLQSFMSMSFRFHWPSALIIPFALGTHFVRRTCRTGFAMQRISTNTLGQRHRLLLKAANVLRESSLSIVQVGSNGVPEDVLVPGFLAELSLVSSLWWHRLAKASDWWWL